ncbi:MAG TPA: ribbon-helix-helix protein, CopG family [Gemmatimonadaceae bacterium]|nr:ribbon-helix-helix protein, CopG family [Gemmatimonadaceae bacterium]
MPMPARKITSNPERLTVTLDATERDELEQLSQQTDRSLAWHVREALHQYLAQTREQSGKGKTS